jgi:hypothetical protein
MAKRKVKAWLCRNSQDAHFFYRLYIRARPPSRRNRVYGIWRDADRGLCADLVHAIGIELRPGEGPVELRVKLVRKRGAKWATLTS